MKDTKQKLLNAAIELLLVNKQATVEEIAQHAGVNKRTLHRYFSGKDHLLAEVFEKIGNEYIEYFIEIIWDENNTIDTLKAIFEHDLKVYSRYETLCHLYNHLDSSYEFNKDLMLKIGKEYTRMFNQLMEEGHCSRSLTHAWLEQYYTSLIKLGASRLKAGVSEDECLEVLWDLFWNGISKREA